MEKTMMKQTENQQKNGMTKMNRNMLSIDQLLSNELCVMVDMRFKVLTKKMELAIIMSHLESEFKNCSYAFYMYYARCFEQSDYKREKCWLELTNMEPDEFKMYFDEIGVRYNSYKEYESTKNPFKNKYYCSIYDKNTKKVFYLRNNELVEKAIKSLATV
jgi:hypothetical protein